MTVFKSFLTCVSCLLVLLGCSSEPQAPDYVLVIHGGAGTIKPELLTTEKATAIQEDIQKALDAGQAILEQGGPALEAVIASISVLEDSPRFNAGKGAVFTSAGTHELDASLMRGSDLQAGAVSGVQHIANPIKLAREVMEASPHVFLVGAGAETFAWERGFTPVESDYFYTDFRWEALQQKLDPDKHGTVGAVALDREGNLAAGTSTGGMTAKKFGRVGDSPIIGAGTFADNRSCAISATGHGEYFIRGTIAHDIAARMRYGGKTLASAAQEVIHGELERLGGTGGVIGLDTLGNFVMTFNTAGMYRGFVSSTGETEIKFYSD